MCWLGDPWQSALFILAPERVLGSVAALPCSAATPLLLRVLGAVQLPAAAATWALTAAVRPATQKLVVVARRSSRSSPLVVRARRCSLPSYGDEKVANRNVGVWGYIGVGK